MPIDKRAHLFLPVKGGAPFVRAAQLADLAAQIALVVKPQPQDEIAQTASRQSPVVHAWEDSGRELTNSQQRLFTKSISCATVIT